MPHTYCTNLIHCVFSTKERVDSISDEIREPLFAYVLGIAKNLSIEILALGGTSNHIHVLIAVPAKHALSEVIRDLKANSSRWMSEKGPAFSWQPRIRRVQRQPVSSSSREEIHPRSVRTPQETNF